MGTPPKYHRSHTPDNGLHYSKQLMLVILLSLNETNIKIFKNLFIYFNWRIITFQYCDGFAIFQHESAIDTYVTPILKPPPSKQMNDCL